MTENINNYNLRQMDAAAARHYRRREIQESKNTQMWQEQMYSSERWSSNTPAKWGIKVRDWFRDIFIDWYDNRIEVLYGLEECKATFPGVLERSKIG